MTPPAIVSPPRPEVVTEGIPRRRAAWIERATSTDHKSVAILYLGTSLCFGALAVVELVLMRVQLIVPENTAIHPEIFDRVLSAFGVTAVILFAIPLALGLIGYIAPLQIGSRGVAFPRLGLLSFWLYLAGAVTVYASFLWTPAETGVAALPPLSEQTFSDAGGVDAWIVGSALAILGFVCFAINLVVTLHNMRAPGMAWRRMPLLSWAAGVSGYLLLAIGPVMLAALTMLFIDRNHGGVFFDAGEGGAPLLYEHLAWFFFTGAYMLVLIVAAGVISDVLPTFARKPLFSHRGAMLSLLAIAVLGPLAWMQNMYTAPIPLGFEIFAMLFALALTVPVGLLVFNWVATLWGGTLHLRAAPLFALGAISAMTIGLAGELAYSVIPVGWQLSNTTAAHGDTFAVLAGGAVLGGFAALHYWFPKLTGRLMGEGMGKAALAAILAGVYVYELTTFFAGLKGQPVDVYKFFEGNGLDGFNLVASIAAFVLAAGILLELANVAHSWGHGVRAGHDPWGGATLEWFALSPPPEHNFDAIPDVRSAEPLDDIRRAIRDQTEGWRPPRPPPATEPPAREPEPAQATGGDDPGSQGPSGGASVA
ncbi:MAG: cbb3-type cytochrome c oxidase subunit I [Actinomycetota bacterium]